MMPISYAADAIANITTRIARSVVKDDLPLDLMKGADPMSAEFLIDPPSFLAGIDDWVAHRAMLDGLPGDDESVVFSKAHADHRISVLRSETDFGKRRLGTAWRSPEPIPFERPTTAKAEAAIGGRLAKALAALGADVATALRKGEKVTKATPADPDSEDVEDRARHRADDIVDAFNLGSLYAEAEPIGADLEDVVTDTVSRAVARVGPNDGGFVNQVNARAVAYARERAAELVGMHFDADGKLVPSNNAEMAITDTTREMLRATIADDLAAGMTTDEIADDITKHYAFSPERAAVIAASEVSRANSEAAFESYRAAAEAGVSVRKTWLAEADCKIASNSDP